MTMETSTTVLSVEPPVTPGDSSTADLSDGHGTHLMLPVQC